MSGWHSGFRTIDGGPVVEFYERVKVVDTAADERIRGKFGWMRGVSADEEAGIILGYSVHFDDWETGFFVNPRDVEATGDVAPRERFYAGASIRVRVDQQGRGYLAD